MSPTPTDIKLAVQQAGVIGAGGGGFPTHIKLDATVDTIIANGSECEPLLASDKTLIKEKAYRIIQGIQLVMTATGAKTGYIAVKGHYHEAVNALQQVLPADHSIHLHLLENYYPAGDEFLTVYDVTRRVIPEGGLPFHVGVLVSNVLSLVQIADALDGKPVTERPVTIAGSVRYPQVVTVPIGTLYHDLITLAGGTLNPTDKLLDGGPMMGQPIYDTSSGIGRTTSGIIALPEDHFIINMKQLTIQQMVKKSKAACCQCFRCTDLCPRNLLGHALYPHMTMRTIDYNMSEPVEHITSAFLCSQCGVCELIACDFMQLSPRQIYSQYRRLLSAKGIKNPHHNPTSAREELENRKIPMSTIIKKTGLTPYLTPTPYQGFRDVSRVRVPLTRHAGSPAVSCVNIGQKVRRGEIIATSPMEKMGAVCHASIGGKITDITNQWIEINAL